MRIFQDLVDGRAIHVSRSGWVTLSSTLPWVKWVSAYRMNAPGCTSGKVHGHFSPLGQCRRGRVNWDLLLSLCTSWKKMHAKCQQSSPVTEQCSISFLFLRSRRGRH